MPDAAGEVATARMLALLGDGDFVLALISGGASALLSAGAPISVLKSARKHLSRVEDGQHAAVACPARMTARPTPWPVPKL